MRRILACLAVAACTGGCMSNTPAATPPAPAGPAAEQAGPWAGPTFKRMTIMVSDLPRAVRLWRDIMGFEVSVNPPSSPDSYSYPVFNIDRAASIQYAMVSAGPFQQRTLALAQIQGQPVVVNQSPRVAAAVINANGRLGEIIAAVSAEGLTVIPSHPLVSQTQGVGVEQAFLDWDGHLIVLYEFPTPAPQDRN